jgi:hypothetical protein
MAYRHIISHKQSDFFPESVAPPTIPSGRAIKVPKPLAFEYAPLTCAPYNGCGFGCTYCCIPLFTQHQNSRAVFDAGAVPKEDFLNDVEHDARRLAELGIHDQQILLCFASDPYPPVADTTLTRKVIEVLNKYNQPRTLLTRAGERSLRDLDLFRTDRDAYGNTLISVDDAFTRKWELNAPSPGERIAALRKAHEMGFFTWNSGEPVIHPEHIFAMVRATYPFTNHYKFGPLNHFPKVVAHVNWRDFTLRMVDLLTKVNRTAYFKKELQRYLPKGYPNPMRIQQHF